jgi:hypothetical protein
MTEHVKACPLEALAEHLSARPMPAENVADWLDYSLNRCGLMVVGEADYAALKLTRPEPSLNGNAELVELIQSRKNQDFDGECLLTNAEVDEIIAALSTPHGDAK